MYIEKFESNTIDQALKNIKEKFGPDAIILKTVSNKGLSGALKKNKVEVTAAISEEEYKKKQSVDKVLGDKYKKEFYQSPSEHVSEMIDNYSKTSSEYGNLGLNKVVKQVNRQEGLDHFLSVNKNTPVNDYVSENDQKPPVRENLKYIERIEFLEKQVSDLYKLVENFKKPESSDIRKAKVALRSFGLNESFIDRILEKASFEMTDEELNSKHNIFEIVLREMSEVINIDLPKFSNARSESSTITFLLSESSMGQSSTAYKLSALKENSVLIRYLNHTENYNLSKNIFNIDVVNIKSMPEIVTECRKAMKNNKDVFIDYKVDEKHFDELSGFVKGLKRSFSNIEFLTCLSAVCSEDYNRKVLNRYRDLLDGVILTKLDICLDFGSLFNLHADFNELPLKMYTTGQTIPDDLETATKERLLNEIFKFDKNTI